MALWIMRYLAILSMLFFLLSVCTSGNKEKNTFNIILITIDALRADHLSCYGYHRKTTPAIDKIAEQAIIYSNAIAPSSWTRPSLASLFTSVYPSNHGVVNDLRHKNDPSHALGETFSEQLTTLAEALKAQGYTTFAVASNPHLHKASGFERGFDYFECLDGKPAVTVNKTLNKWEGTIRKSEKFFIWVHYFDPHYPYFPKSPWMNEYNPPSLTQKLNFSRKPFKEIVRLLPDLEKNSDMLGNLMALYDSEINYVDSFIGKFINKFNLGDNTLLIITSDHGEEFLEHHLLGHGYSLYQASIHIPLIIKLPGNNQKGIDEKYVTLLDIMPTIFDLLGCAPPDHILGTPLLPEKSLFPWIAKVLPWKNTPRYIFSELHTLSHKTVLSSGWKYYYAGTSEEEYLFNIETDPLEVTNLIDEEKEKGRLLKRRLLNWADNTKRYPATKNERMLSKEEQEKLEALGYAGAD